MGEDRVRKPNQRKESGSDFHPPLGAGRWNASSDSCPAYRKAWLFERRPGPHARACRKEQRGPDFQSGVERTGQLHHRGRSSGTLAVESTRNVEEGHSEDWLGCIMKVQLVRAVRRRAGYACEYCRLPAGTHPTPFEIEHIVPKQHGGATALSNLAYACLHCNRHKGPNLSGFASSVREPSSFGYSTRVGISGIDIFDGRAPSW
jgi:hypothetical protein